MLMMKAVLRQLPFLESANADPAETYEKQDWQDFHQQKLMNAMKALDERSQDIFSSRVG